MNFDDFNLDLYEEMDFDEANSDVMPASSVFSSNSSTSIVCATLTNLTEICHSCDRP
ncbi:hypothetical protein [uncultured Dubosiella sp.]|uniref:hypothetical protein n=1 Tax=uncultured Dubosiella sp. TaxID=1937011 RepID=UPI0025B50711|nr:hypothetical protein [uncultured Dubosiella sp.]